MKLEEVKDYFGTTGYAFSKATGFHHSAYKRWERMGYIPIESQLRITRLTFGALEVSLEHLNYAG